MYTFPAPIGKTTAGDRSASMRGSRSLARWLASVFFFVPAIALSQDANPPRTLVINGQPGELPLIQVNGRSYVDVVTLARAANASLSFSGNQTILTLPGTSAPAASQATPPPSAPPANQGFSKGFLDAGIEQMSSL